VWDGPIDNWIAACDAILALDVDVVVPGHGPLTDKHGVQDTKDYWLRLQEIAADSQAVDPLAAGVAESIALGLLGNQSWSEAERLVINVDTALRELVRDRSRRDPLTLLARMARHKVG
jgi:glyoxylase-like metal-dependent hydrolase (beta-lactamase superfamily II)